MNIVAWAQHEQGLRIGIELQDHIKEMVGLRHGQGPTPGAPVPQGPEASKLEQSIQNLNK